MALSVQSTPQTALSQPAVRKIGMQDIRDALRAGLEDFRLKPTHLYFLGVIYPLVTLGAFLVVFDYSLLPLVFPVVAGSLIIGPFLTIAMCEISRRRERGEDISSRTAGNFLSNPSARDILVLGAFLVGLFFFWVTIALSIYNMTLGDPWATVVPYTIGEFVTRLFTTAEGWALIAVGNTIGFLFALAALCIGAVSFPLLLDRPVGVSTAITTSIRAFQANPVILAVWGLIVAMTLFIGAIPFLVGLAVIVPVLGHATWHLYRRLVV